ncbi:MAG: serine/threonine-protein kinase [Candidatus Cloacimonadaceae bacterium]|jgi:serine/threonine protein kinase|nr:serine/threonine protein kinase [Candidatus Cloacimonadota bacterium]MDX9950257.1 serine/threonine-protein kinase [Candidatus Syntrophosphaera sp.]
MILNPGDIIRSYRILDHLGEGGMGKVFLAEEELLARKVAIKMLNPSITHQEQFRQRFIEEARIQAKMKHPNIVSLLSFFNEEDGYFMVMEFAPGKTLRELIRNTGPVPEQRTRVIFRQILSALEYAHEQGVVHRDIKPSNIMIDENDELKVLDFGVARLLEDPHLTQTGSRVGTVFYMSPEQVETPREVDSRSDIYSAGVLLFELLTGRLPFDTEAESNFQIEKAIVEQALPNPRDFYPFMSDLIVKLMHALTAKDPALRPSASEAIKILDSGDLSSVRVVQPEPITPLPMPSQNPIVIPVPKRKKMSKGLRAFLIILLLCVLAIPAGFLTKYYLEGELDIFGRKTDWVEEDETLVNADDGPSQAELDAIAEKKKLEKAEQAVRAILPKFDYIKREALDYKQQDFFDEWPPSLDYFVNPKEVNTTEFQFEFNEGIITAISQPALGKVGVRISYSIDSERFEIKDPDPGLAPRINPAWLQ